MITRKRSPFKRFLLLIFTRLLLLAGLGLLWVGGSIGWVLATRDQRAVEVVSPNDAAPARAPDSLRVLTYNIAHGRGGAFGALNTDGGTPEEKRERLERMGRDLGRLGLDLIALHEVDFNTWWSGGIDQAEIIAEAAGMPHIVRQRNFDTGIPFFRRYDFGNVLLSRFPVVEAEKIEFPPKKEHERVFAGNHDGFWARVRIGEDRDIKVVVAHLEVRSEDVRVRAAGEIVRVQRGTSLPMIVMGDLNSTPPGFPDSRVSAGGQNAIEILESFGGFQRRPMRGQATPRDFTFPSEAPRRIIDWILPDRNWTFVQYEVLHGFTESDHFPVMATLRLR